LDGYVVNGFQEGGVDPVGPAVAGGSTAYPNFQTLPDLADSHTNKSVGGRAHALINHSLGIGASYYTGRWTAQTDPARYLTMVGLDGQLYITNKMTFRAGFATMTVQLPPTATAPSFLRNGTYAELSQRFGHTDQFTAMLRGGTIDLDNRIVNADEKRIGALKLIWKPNELEFSIEHSHDFEYVVSKSNYEYTNLRVVASF
jgi:hypothetical protein